MDSLTQNSLFQLNHYGFACKNIEESIPEVISLCKIKTVGTIFFDPLQTIRVCLLFSETYCIELVEGDKVTSFLDQEPEKYPDLPVLKLKEKHIIAYHRCYEVKNLEQVCRIMQEKHFNCLLEPTPAVLFNGRKIAFFLTSVGLIEFLEDEHPTLDPQINVKIKTLLNEAPDHRLYISANFTSELIAPSLQFWLKKLKLNYQIRFADYNQVFQALLNRNSIAAQKNGVNIILIRIEDWFIDFFKDQSIEIEKLKSHLQSISDDFIEILSNFMATTPVKTLLVLCPASPLLDLQVKKTLEQIEAKILALRIEGVNLISGYEVIKKYSIMNFYNAVTEQTGKIPYQEEFFHALGTEISRSLYGLHHKPYKLIAVDCDNTLWKGVCAEEGTAKIAFEQHHIDLQKFLISQQEKGTLICLCSKNEEHDVLKVLNTRQEMLLKKEHLVSMKINWMPKSQNLIELAQELDLGIDSFIFIDDNPIECAEVSAHCPSVLTLHFPTEEQKARLFLKSWVFDRGETTAEDASRTQMYQEQSERELFRKKRTLADFINELNLEIQIDTVSTNDIKRACQLIKKTNQFNASGAIYNEVDLIEKEQFSCFVVHVKDRFGDYGLVGCMVAQINNDNLHLKGIWLSCRALGRGVEHKMLAWIGQWAVERKLVTIFVDYKKTERNEPVTFFLEKNFSLENNQFSKLAVEAQACSYNPDEDSDASTQTREMKAIPLTKQVDTELHGLLIELDNLDKIKNAIKRSNIRNIPISTKEHFNECQNKILALWQDILPLSNIGLDDNFLQIGGNSLLMTQMHYKLQLAFQINVDITELYQHCTIHSLSQLIAKKLSSSMNFKTKNNTTRSFSNQYDLWMPLSYIQMIHWFGKSTTWQNYIALHICLRGEIDIEKLEQAINRTYNENPMWKVYISKNETKQRYINANTIDITHIKVGEQDEMQVLCSEYIKINQKPLKMENDSLVVCKIIRCAKSQKTYILVGCAHIVCDFSSLKAFLQKIIFYYPDPQQGRENTLTENLFYSCLTQENEAVAENAEAYIHFWEKYSKNAKKICVPFKLFEIKKEYCLDNLIIKNMNEEKLSRLNRIFAKNGLTFNMGLLSLMGVLIGFYTQSNEGFLYNMVTGRTTAELENILAPLWDADLYNVNLKIENSLSEHFATFIQEVTTIAEQQKAPLQLKLYSVDKHYLRDTGGFTKNLLTKKLHKQLLGYMDARMNAIISHYLVASFMVKLSRAYYFFKKWLLKRSPNKSIPLTFFVNVLYLDIDEAPPGLEIEQVTPKLAAAAEDFIILYVYMKKDGSADFAINSLVSPEYKRLILEDIFFIMDQVISNDEIDMRTLMKKLSHFSTTQKL